MTDQSTSDRKPFVARLKPGDSVIIGQDRHILCERIIPLGSKNVTIIHVFAEEHCTVIRAVKTQPPIIQ